MNSSVLWIFLIVAWLFILLPMVLRGRPEVRKTTEAAANTRLLHRGGERAAVRRRAAGRHPSNPDYVRKRARTEAALQRPVIEETAVEPTAVPADAAEDPTEVTDVIEAVDADDIIDAEAVDLDDDFEGEDAEAEADLEEPDLEEPDEELEGEADDDLDADDEADEHEVDELDDEVDDLDELEESKPAAPKARELRGRAFTPDAIAERDARRYRERQRMVAGLTVATLLAVVSCFYWQPYGFLATAVMVVLSGLYLFFLRRTAIAEQQHRAQRAARLRRHAVEDDRLRREQEEAVPVRPGAPARRRPGGMIVLELDDEDPAFDHLPTYDFGYAAGAEPVDSEYRHAV
ncbi:divisome protein SepX/GlpR [Gordonia caeni]|uniref:Transmembrane protein n=1 Tax=Gordonia caeni TaxID=1007097 RepID=A0ABP7PUF1_9ACTN